MEWMFGLLLIAIVLIGAIFKFQDVQERKVAAMPPDERAKYLQERADYWRKREDARREADFGTLNPRMICPHCQTGGMVRTKAVTQKKGISGGKATAALLTGGVSMLATGLSRKEALTQAHCDSCNSTWLF